MYTIYLITNIINNKLYIGFTTKTVEVRFGSHIKQAFRNSMLPIHCALRKYGRTNFSLSILKQGEDNEWGLKVEEPYYIGMYCPEYNLCGGGQGPLNYCPTNEQRKKMSDKSLATWSKPEHRKKMYLSRKGHIVSDTTRKKIGMSNSKPGRVIDPNGKEHVFINMSEFCRNHHISQANLSGRGYASGYKLIE